MIVFEILPHPVRGWGLLDCIYTWNKCPKEGREREEEDREGGRGGGGERGRGREREREIERLRLYQYIKVFTMSYIKYTLHFHLPDSADTSVNLLGNPSSFQIGSGP